MRAEFPAKVRAAAFLRADGKCEICHAKIVGRAEYDHIIPDGLGGTPDLDNCQVTCSKCHRLKTSSEDVPRIAKAKRQQRSHIGAKAKRPFPGSKASSWKKRMDGTTERRER